MKIKHLVKQGLRYALRRINPDGRQNAAGAEFHELKETQEMAEAAAYVDGFDREHVWVFCSGQASQDFRGNPKYLFAYISRYRKDIRAYWLCSEEETLQQIRALGFKAYNTDSPEAQYLINRTGVMVAEQVKHAMPDGLHNVKYVNLWHGVGFKKVERSLHKGDLAIPIAHKYIDRGAFYRDHQIVGVTCPTIEQEYVTDLGVDLDHFIHAGYLRCEYQQNFEPVVSFEHDLRKVKELPDTVKLAVYAPTYRARLEGTFAKAIPDFEALYRFCEEHQILFIFKVHPNMENEVGFLNAWKQYGDRKYFWFWDNKNDFYEIMDQIDLAVVDYSGIISDMVAVGIKHYIRYVFDFDEYMESVSIHDNYMEKTTGIMCYSFDELLTCMSDFETRDESAEIERLNRELWPYAHGKEDFDRIIEATFNFEVKEREHRTLYSFDVFDTLISRKVLAPKGIFYYVKEQIDQDGSFPPIFAKKYPFIRMTTELSVRETSYKTEILRGSEFVEITLDQILERMAYVYQLTDEQIGKLRDWEINAELDNVVPLPQQIDRLKHLVSAGETVVLISDMYLPKDVILAMLEKADPVLTSVPLFLSNEYGVLKTTGKLYFEVYKSFKPYYDFEKWIHYGDSETADRLEAKKFGISPRKINKLTFNPIQQSLVDHLDTYDGYKVAAMQARMCEAYPYETDSLVISFIGLCFIPYIDWVLRDAEKRGYKTLYFVSRDGHHLKRIADAMIRERGLSFKTRYIYASRKTWRIPSFIHEIDADFWEGYGSFGDIVSKPKLLGALYLTEDKFRELFPGIELNTINFNDREAFDGLKELFKNSKRYQDYILSVAAEERTLVRRYLLQEIDPAEPFAVVEYYGRGYTQDCMDRLWQDAIDDPGAHVPFYYSRSVLPSMNGTIRHHFTTNNGRQYFIESIFANMPYRSIASYKEENGVIRPVIEPLQYDPELFETMNRLLPMLGEQYAGLKLDYPEDTDRMLYDFVFDYYSENRTDPVFAEQFGRLKDSVTLYGNLREFAPPYTKELINSFTEGELSRGMMRVTSDMVMSYARTTGAAKEKYDALYQVLPDTEIVGTRMLTDEEQAENAAFKKKYLALEKESKRFEEMYQKEIAGCSVEKRILIITQTNLALNWGLSKLKEKLTEKTDYTVVSYTGITGPSEKIANELARARYVITDEPIAAFCGIRFREGTEQILLCKIAFRLRNDALASDLWLRWKKKYRVLAGKNDISVLQLPAAGRVEFYKRWYASE